MRRADVYRSGGGGPTEMGSPVTSQNGLNEHAVAVPAFSRPEEFPMTECSDTESCEFARPSRRLRLVWDDSDAGPEVRNAATLIGVLATRVGAVPHGSVLLGAIRRQRWSPLNVPLIWGAASQAESCPVFAWLVSVTSAVDEALHFYGGETTASDAVRIG